MYKQGIKILAKIIAIIGLIIGSLIIYYGYISLKIVNPLIVDMYYVAGGIVILGSLLALVVKLEDQQSTVKN